jgi:DNA-binding CsgD family transcriptional regulator
MQQTLNPADSRTRTDMPKRLTAREQEIYWLLRQGMTRQQIADKLFISPRTVDKHRENMRIKLGVHNTMELIQAGMRMGMVTEPIPPSTGSHGDDLSRPLSP